MHTLPEALRAVVRHNGPRTAIVDPEGRFTWTEFIDRVARAAAVLRERGVRAGERFAILSQNSFRHEELKWAGLWLGAIPVPVNWRYAPPEIEHVLTDAGCRFVAVQDRFLEVFDADGLAPWRDSLLEVPSQYEAALAKAEPVDPFIGDPGDDAMLIYTGGTTGRSKGVRITHTNIISNGAAFGLAVGARRDDVYLHAAPMFHSADLLATGWFLQGAAQAYLPAFSPAAFLGTIQDLGVTAVVTVPTMLMMTVTDPDFGKFDVSGLRTLIYGAAPMALEWIQRVAKAFPHVRFCNSYGLTETAPDVTVFDPEEFRAAIDSGERDGPVRSVGKPNILNEVKVVGPDGAELPPGEVGELWTRGPNIMKGYWNLPQETDAALVGGWFRTGDVARIDEAGYVYLLDRMKDIVISGGENIYTSEVEAAIYRHPAVQECAVIGVPDDKMGESLMAVVVTAPDARPAAEEMVEHCRPLIAGYKIPRRFEFVAAMPKSAMGKILKADLRRTYGG